MSTFDGIVEEFPNIRIDYFRHQPSKTPPAACFLSHIHSDHLLGLETLKMPFVYCSAATRCLLLRMEKYPHRINFSKGILEARKQTYKHLKTILRPLPLQSPVDLELGPKSRIRVTLFDANHCPGAVMFLIEGDRKAVLYTGDIRAEPWWVNSIVRSPVLIPYTCGTKRLDCIYLDTTFASRQDLYREFPTKAEGLTELMKKVMKCPPDSIFYFRAWTLGYEDVWIMLSNLLTARVHVDSYQLRLFRSLLEDGHDARPSPILTGFQVGNHEQPGFLTTDPDAKIHSCEPGTSCHARLKKNRNVVWITPIVSRLRNGTEVAEVGAGGGKGDLYQQQCEVELASGEAIESLRGLCRKIAADTSLAAKLENMLSRVQTQQDHRVVLDDFEFDPDTDLTISDFLKLLAKVEDSTRTMGGRSQEGQSLIHFPYSRHSSYTELRHLVSVFQPNDICPCTVDINNWDDRELSMKSLFGDICSGKDFKYDKAILRELKRRQKGVDTSTDHEESQTVDTQHTETPTEEGSQSRYHTLSGAEECGQQTYSPFGNVAVPEQSNQGSTNSRDVLLADDSEHLAGYGKAKDRLHDAWRAANNGSDTYMPSTAGEEASTCTVDLSNNAGHDDFYDYLSSIDADVAENENGAGLDGPDDGYATGIEVRIYQSKERKRRRLAFEAARKCLTDGDPEAWSELRLRSVGWEGHTRQEMEL